MTLKREGQSLRRRHWPIITANDLRKLQRVVLADADADYELLRRLIIQTKRSVNAWQHPRQAFGELGL
jgi:hypothetical protein